MAFPFALAAGAAASGAGLLGSLLSRPQTMSVPDIGAELGRIRALYDQARQTAVANIRQEAAQTRGQAASNLAARGIYRAPVSENVFGRLAEATGRDIATAQANIGAQEADATSRALAALIGAQQQASMYNAQQQAQRQSAIYGGLGSLGSSLLQYGMSGQQKPPAPPQGMAGFGAPTQDFNNLVSPYQPSPAARQFMNWRYGPFAGGR